MSSPLVVPSHAPLDNGCVVHVTPESADWTYVGFAVHQLAVGGRLELSEDGREDSRHFISGNKRAESAAPSAIPARNYRQETVDLSASLRRH